MVAGRYFTFNEASAYLGLSSNDRKALNKLIEKGYILSFKDKSGRILIEKCDIDSYLDKCKKGILV